MVELKRSFYSYLYASSFTYQTPFEYKSRCVIANADRGGTRSLPPADFHLYVKMLTLSKLSNSYYYRGVLNIICGRLMCYCFETINACEKEESKDHKIPFHFSIRKCKASFAGKMFPAVHFNFAN